MPPHGRCCCRIGVRKQLTIVYDSLPVAGIDAQAIILQRPEEHVLLGITLTFEGELSAAASIIPLQHSVKGFMFNMPWFGFICKVGNTWGGLQERAAAMLLE